MTVIVFLIDNSASMNQRTYLGTTLLDVAKGCVETISKIRLKYSRGDRYFLMTLEREPHNVKLAGWKQNGQSLHSSLDSIKADGLTSLGAGLRRVFDMLNLNRMQLGHENYAMGRYPSQIEPAIVICITDGRRLTSEDGVVNGGLNLPMLDQGFPGHEYTEEPFRWDYRLYGLVLRLPAIQEANFEMPKFIPTDDESPIHSMCEVTGGRAYKVMNERMLNQCLESLAQKCQPGVVVHFTKMDEGDASREESAKWHSCRRMIYVKTSARSANATWPIPEAFWSDPSILSERLPPRLAHPIICYSCTKHRPPKVLENFPVDRYELEPSPLTQYILERRDPSFVWQCYVPHSGKDRDYPFGYLKASSDLMSVNLTILPYNYPVLTDLLVELAETHKMRMNNEAWGNKFGVYLGQIPCYYYQPLTKAFEKLGFRGVIKAEAVEQVLPYNLKHHLQKLRHAAKAEYDRFIQQVETKIQPEDTIQVIPSVSIVQRSDFSQLMSDLGDNLAGVSAVQQHHKQWASLDIRAIHPTSTNQQTNLLRTYEDARHIDRHALREMLPKMRNNLLAILDNRDRPMDRDAINSQPMAEMGNYSNYKFASANSPLPLREINPPPVRVDTFGNPFRRKATAFVADEGFVDDTGMASMVTSPEHVQVSQRKRISSDSSCTSEGRSKGPISYDISFDNWRRTPPASPALNHDSEIELSIHEQMDTNDFENPDNIIIHQSNGYIPQSNTNSNSRSIAPQELKRTLRTNQSKQSFTHNSQTVDFIVHSIREPLIDGSTVFDRLRSLKGATSQRLACVSVLVAEAQRFKRPRLVQLFEDYRQFLQNDARASLIHNGKPKENNGLS